jgi:haloacetate dehalogenase
LFIDDRNPSLGFDASHRSHSPPQRGKSGGTHTVWHALSGVMQDFTSAHIQTGQTSIFVRISGSGPPLLLLHGFPQTHVMWRGVAPLLAREFTVVCADLRGYGQSGCPASAPDHAPYAKGAMARDMVTVMERLGFTRFLVAGHDRGGRVAYRMALDHPDHIERLAVLDILPIETAWERADADFTLGYWPWSLLAQPEPLPETILATSAEAIIDNALGGWGSPSQAFPPEVRAAYIEALRDIGHAHAICEEYRAAASIDRAHDRADRDAGRKIRAPVLAIWSAQGPLDIWYAEGPVTLWRQWAGDVRGYAIKGGHFFPEAAPELTAQALRRFFAHSD